VSDQRTFIVTMKYKVTTKMTDEQIIKVAASWPYGDRPLAAATLTDALELVVLEWEGAGDYIAGDTEVEIHSVSAEEYDPGDF